MWDQASRGTVAARGQALELLLDLNERLREPPQSIRELGRIWKR